MVTVLQHRLALVALVGVLLIPMLSVNNQGLSHLRLCEASVEQQLAAGPAEDGERSEVQFRGAEVCAEVRASIGVIPDGDDRVLLTVTIINDSSLSWQGSVGLAAEGEKHRADLTAVLGEIPAGGEESATIALRILPDQTTIRARLVLGP